jgi:hypothetical protein
MPDQLASASSSPVLSGGRGIWVYAVAATIRREWFGSADGIGARPVWGITGRGGPAAGGLAAAVSGVSLEEFGPAVLHRNLADPDWRDRTALTHWRVADLVAAHLPAVPMQLGAVYPDEAAVVSMLADRRAEFAAALLNVAALDLAILATPTPRAEGTGPLPVPADLPDPAQLIATRPPKARI